MNICNLNVKTVNFILNYVKHRFYCTAIAVEQGSTQKPRKRQQKNVAAPKEKVAKDITEYFKAENSLSTISKFPEKLLQKKGKSPEIYYIADTKAAEIIADWISKDSDKNVPFFETNPGPGLLTKELLKRNFKDVRLYESNKHFDPDLKKIVESNPRNVRLTYGDFLGHWKLSFQDKFDNGNRVAELLVDVPKRDWNEGINCRIFFSTSSVNFIKCLINSIVFQNGFLAHGRPEMYFVMPPPLYIHLTCSKEAGYLLYRATSILFQILFEYEYVSKIPREYFLPWQFEYTLSKKKKLTRVKSIHPEYLYLVKAVPRANLYELCLPDNLQSLWFFIKQHCVSRKNRVIPTLERWIPNSGSRLIINTKNSVSVELTNKYINLKELPKYSVPSTTMSLKDFYKKINIFTEFGDLTPSQMLTLFNQFVNWPEFKQSPFLASMENNLLKLESAEDSLDIEDDVEDDVKKEKKKIKETALSSI